MFKKLVVFMLLVCFSVISLFGCGQGDQKSTSQPAQEQKAETEKKEESKEKPDAKAAQGKKIVVASFYPVDQTSGWPSLVERFEKDNPGVKIEVQYTPGGQYIAKLLTQLASGTVADVIGVEVSHVAKFVNKNLLTDLTPMIEKDNDIALEDYFPHLLDYFTVNGKVYGLPYDSQPLVPLFYNKKAFTEANVSFPTNEWDWNNLLDAAQKLTKTENGQITQYGFYTGDWPYFLYANGAGIVDNIKAPTKGTIDSPEVVQGIQFFVDLIHKYKVSPSPASLQEMGATGGDMFATGKIAMYLAGYWELVFSPERWKQLDLGMVMAPKGFTGKRGYSTGGTAYAVANGSKNPELAFQFVKYFMGRPGWEAASKSAKFGIIYPPAHIPSFESELYLKHPNPPIENMYINGEGTKYANFPPFNENWVEIRDKVIKPKMDLILLNKLPVEQTLKEINPQITEKLNAKN